MQRFQQQMQQTMMQPQMTNMLEMRRQMQNILNEGKFGTTEKMNISFHESSGLRLNFVIDYGTKIKDVLDKFSEKVGIPKFNFTFLCNGEKLKYDDERKIEDHLIDGIKITAIRFK